MPGNKLRRRTKFWALRKFRPKFWTSGRILMSIRVVRLRVRFTPHQFCRHLTDKNVLVAQDAQALFEKLFAEHTFKGIQLSNLGPFVRDRHTGTEVGGRRAYLFKYKCLVIAMQGKFGQKVFSIALEVINQCISAL